jgi:hypothetical protein
VDCVDAVVFTQGAPYGGSDLEAADYAGVRNILAALDGGPARIAPMTAIGVTAHTNYYDWKRRSERLVRASGCSRLFHANFHHRLLQTGALVVPVTGGHSLGPREAHFECQSLGQFLAPDWEPRRAACFSSRRPF